MAEGLAVQPVDTRKQKFAQILKSKLEQGYRIESQSETDAVLFTGGRRSWFGLFAGRGKGGRQMISVDEHGEAKTQNLSPDETSDSDEVSKSRAS